MISIIKDSEEVKRQFSGYLTIDHKVIISRDHDIDVVESILKRMNLNNRWWVDMRGSFLELYATSHNAVYENYTTSKIIEEHRDYFKLEEDD